MTEAERRVFKQWEKLEPTTQPPNREAVLRAARAAVKAVRQEGLDLHDAVSALLTALVMALPSHGGTLTGAIHRVAIELAGRAAQVQAFVNGSAGPKKEA